MIPKPLRWAFLPPGVRRRILSESEAVLRDLEGLLEEADAALADPRPWPAWALEAWQARVAEARRRSEAVDRECLALGLL